ncbi:MAG: N-terminal phage integrase SAM-like domain-containing protein [Candidatus Acidiferrales bacterium]
MSRRRFQKGTLILWKGKSRSTWIGRWYEPEIRDGKLHLERRSQRLGYWPEMPKKEALRALQAFLDTVNDPRFLPLDYSTFNCFAERWRRDVATQFEASTQASIRGHLDNFILPYFGPMQVRDIKPFHVQRFIASIKRSPKTVRNIVATLRMMWRQTKPWGLASHDALEAVVLPTKQTKSRFHFSLDE